MLDADGDGRIDQQELLNVFGNGVGGNSQGEELWSEIMKDIDKDGDGLISFEEFNSTMNEVIQKRATFSQA